ncbi:MAG: NAD+ synthase [Candidatus Omnitrophica bacterium]|nr:NAD+ synthase [Candidatus Omnitrophota bacterium]
MKRKIVLWVKDELKRSGAKGIVLGLSGGVDSAVVAALAKEAAGRKNLLALILPCHSHSRDVKDALMVAKRLKIKVRQLDLTPLYEQLIKILPKAKGLAVYNLKPRLRMTVLYYFANKLNYLVCGTGNKSEFLVGYFTKHGDGATDILPIGDLFKKEVRVLARELGIPKEIIDKPPSAGLWAGQTDENELGITYDELDGILKRTEGKRRQSAPPDKVNKVKRLVKGSEHKRQGPRICYIEGGFNHG